MSLSDLYALGALWIAIYQAIVDQPISAAASYRIALDRYM